MVELWWNIGLLPKSVPWTNFGSQYWFPLANFDPPYENVNSKQSKVAS